ncbi:hypothetical protein [Roseomonas chloroacetimidivorans]|uniref:hypothetical protein n=1 Tax=Roseomonas chloroacetimidivorans TaxID=1766656 RepID=UPI003C70795C
MGSGWRVGLVLTPSPAGEPLRCYQIRTETAKHIRDRGKGRGYVNEHFPVVHSEPQRLGREVRDDLPIGYGGGAATQPPDLCLARTEVTRSMSNGSQFG